MDLLIGIDDTDTRETRGTGYHARQLAARIAAAGLGGVAGITRHQNYVHPDIPYTSQNSSACLAVNTPDPDGLKALCRTFLLEIAPVGSDVGLCMARPVQVGAAIESWGRRAKKEVLSRAEARQLALSAGVYLEGLTGTYDGIIGALAAVGLRKGGNDGRFIWLRKKRELRDMLPGFYSPAALARDLGVGLIVDKEGKEILPPAEVYIHEWFRPVLRKNAVTLIVEKTHDNGKDFWTFADKDFIRAHS